MCVPARVLFIDRRFQTVPGIRVQHIGHDHANSISCDKQCNKRMKQQRKRLKRTRKPRELDLHGIDVYDQWDHKALKKQEENEKNWPDRPLNSTQSKVIGFIAEMNSRGPFFVFECSPDLFYGNGKICSRKKKFSYGRVSVLSFKSLTSLKASTSIWICDFGVFSVWLSLLNLWYSSSW